MDGTRFILLCLGYSVMPSKPTKLSNLDTIEHLHFTSVTGIA